MALSMAGKTVGIIGGGQLAQMLVEAAHRLGLDPVVLVTSPADPAAQVCKKIVVGHWTDEKSLRQLFEQTEIVAFENEFIPCDLVEKAAQGLSSGRRVRFFPSLGAIRKLQDKLEQKAVLRELSIPAPEYEPLPPGADPASWFKKVSERFGGRCVLKWARLGYDGKGTFLSKGGRSDVAAAEAFCAQAAAKGVPVFAEAMIPFKRELAVVASYSVTGEFAAYPLVISQQEKGICRLVVGPATSFGVGEETERLAHEYARKVASKLDLHGTFAIEFFEAEDPETGKTRLLVNELAPRVHNTGHYTQDAAETSQFENHWRAILGMPLGDVAVAPGFSMLNLLGPEVSGPLSGHVAPKVAEGPKPGANRFGKVKVHWYGKDLRPGRKLGHLNARAESVEEVTQLVHELEACEREWLEQVTKASGEPGDSGVDPETGPGATKTKK